MLKSPILPEITSQAVPTNNAFGFVGAKRFSRAVFPAKMLPSQLISGRTRRLVFLNVVCYIEEIGMTDRSLAGLLRAGALRLLEVASPRNDVCFVIAEASRNRHCEAWECCMSIMSKPKAIQSA